MIEGVDRATLWQHRHAERAALARTLAGLPREAWDHPSLCPGWTVKDVAAHVISAPQTGWGDVARMLVRNLGRGVNAAMEREMRRLSAEQTPEMILADYEDYAFSTRHSPTTGTTEPLLDVLVHHQDIARPLGIEHHMDPEAAAVAADRSRLLSPVMGSWRVVRGVRLVADDVDWARGHGPEVTGPMEELLMVCAGRARAARGLAGPGVDRLT